MNTWLKPDRGPVKYQFALESLGNVKAQYLLTSRVFSSRHLVWLAWSADCCSENVTPLVREKCHKWACRSYGLFWKAGLSGDQWNWLMWNHKWNSQLPQILGWNSDIIVNKQCLAEMCYVIRMLPFKGLAVKMCDSRSLIPSQVVAFELLGFT